MAEAIKPSGYSSYTSNHSNESISGDLKPREKATVPALTISDKQPGDILPTIDTGQVKRPIDQTEVKNINIKDSQTLLAEANKILRAKKKVIRKNFRAINQLENNIKNNPMETDENLLDIIEAFEKHTIQGSESSLSETDKEFLQAVLPDSIRENLKNFQNLKHIRKVLQLSVGYINSVKSGSNDVIVIYKTHLLNESNALKKEINRKVNCLIQKNNGSLNLRELKAELTKWKIALEVQNDNLDTFYLDTLSLGLSSGVSALEKIFDFLPFRYLPSKWILESGQKALLFGKGFVDVLSFISASINLFYKGKAHKHSVKWLKNFNEWKANTQSNTASPPLKISSPEEHKKHLHEFLERSNLKKIKIFLSQHSIDPLPSGINTLEDFKRNMNVKDSVLKKTIEDQYVNFQETMQAFDRTINQTQDLLGKRQEIEKKKIYLIEKEIDVLKPTIKNTQLEFFKNSMGKLLNELLTSNNQPLTPVQLEIFENELMRWKLTNSLESNLLNDLLEQINALYLSNGDLSLHQKFSHDFNTFVFGNNELKGLMEAHFEKWFNNQSVNELSKFHVNHQEIILKSTKLSVLNLVNKKFSIEKKFIHFDFFSSIQSFLTKGTWLLVTIGIIALAIFAIAVPGIGWLVLALTIGDVLLTAGLFAAKSYLDFKYKPRSTLLYYLQKDLHTFYLETRLEIREFLNKNKEKKLLASAGTLKNLDLNSPKKNQVEKKFNRIREEYNQGLLRAQEWEKKIQKNEAYINKKRLIDFHAHSGINPVKDFTKFRDYLQIINYALSSCEPKMLDLDDDMKYILETFFQLDISVIQKEMSKNPNVFKEKLANFLSMSQNEMVDFFKYQNLILKEIN